MAKKEVKKTGLDYLKRYWFVGVVCLGLFVFIVAYCVQAIQDRPKYVDTLQENGDYVVFSIDDDKYMAKDLFGYLKDIYADDILKLNFYKDCLDELYETTSQMSQAGANYASYQLQSYTQEQLFEDMLAQGYDSPDIESLKHIYVTYMKSLELVRDYVKENKTLASDYATNNKIKEISHILVKVADVAKDDDGNLKANPTAEEQEKLNKVLEALKTTDFKEVAKQYSEDSSAQSGGSLGFDNMDEISSKYVKTFADAASKLNDGEVSEAVLSEYGWHIITINEPDIDKAIEDTQFISDLYYSDTTILDKALKEIGLPKLKYSINDESFKDLILGGNK